MKAPQAQLKITGTVANPQQVVTHPVCLPGQMRLAPGQRQVDLCAACNLTLAAATEPWCPICNGELQTMDLLPHPPFMEVSK